MSDTATTVDPEAPFGRRPNGVPYKRDPSAFEHLRGKAFGSLNGRVPEKRTPGSRSGKARATASDVPLSSDAKGYAAKFRRLFHYAAKGIAPKAPVPAAIVAVRGKAMAEAWGRASVSHPKLGRTVDRLGKTSDMGDAIGSTLITAAMIAHVGGFTANVPWLANMLDGLVQMTLEEFAAMNPEEFADLNRAEAAAASDPD